jgi:hypothetical protein
MFDVYGQPVDENPINKCTDEHYWSEYRRNYEQSLRKKME